MNKERNNQLVAILEKHVNEMAKRGEKKEFILYNFDEHIKEYIGYTMHGLEKDSNAIKNLDELGFKIIYPAKLSKEIISKMETKDKYYYDYLISRNLIIDGKEENASLEFAKMITDHYLSALYPTKGYWGLYDNKKILTKQISPEKYEEGMENNLKSLLESVGVNPEFSEEGFSRRIILSSDIPYERVENLKLKEIYDDSKEIEEDLDM